MNITQRSVVIISLDPTQGHEQRGVHPAVVISGAAFHASGLCLVCPLTSTIRHLAGNVVLQPNDANNLKQASEILVGHLRSVSQQRIQQKIGVIPEADLQAIFRGIDMLCNR